MDKYEQASMYTHAIVYAWLGDPSKIVISEGAWKGEEMKVLTFLGEEKASEEWLSLWRRTI